MKPGNRQQCIGAKSSRRERLEDEDVDSLDSASSGRRGVCFTPKNSLWMK